MSQQLGFAIELYLDPALENQVLKAWNVLARRQISTHLIEMESRPHITLFSAPFLEPSKLESLLKGFASKHDPLPLTFSSLATFPNDPDNLLFLAPTPSLSLLHLQMPEAFSLLRELKLPVPVRHGYRSRSVLSGSGNLLVCARQQRRLLTYELRYQSQECLPVCWTSSSSCDPSYVQNF
ncbi:hypothetical protein GYH30_051686 [Glycine max]|nr:hypothetical protein GYH30_051686 [Glycine max]